MIQDCISVCTVDDRGPQTIDFGTFEVTRQAGATPSAGVIRRNKLMVQSFPYGQRACKGKKGWECSNISTNLYSESGLLSLIHGGNAGYGR